MADIVIDSSYIPQRHVVLSGSNATDKDGTSLNGSMVKDTDGYGVLRTVLAANWPYDSTTQTLEVTPRGNQSSYIIPMMDLLAWSGFGNQPTNDGVEVLSNSASDVGKCTIFGTTTGTGAFAYETITLTGVTAVATTKVDWGNIYGIFMGDIEGKNITPLVGTLTVREASADQTITTLPALAISKGMVAFNFAGKDILINVHSGNVWKRTAGVVTTANGFKMNLTGGNIKEEYIGAYIYLISDTAGATCQIEVMA